MALQSCTEGSMAERSEQVRGCIGMVLTAVNDNPVRWPSDIIQAGGGVSSSLKLQFKCDPAKTNAVVDNQEQGTPAAARRRCHGIRNWH